MTNASGGVVSAMRSRGVYAHYAYGEVRASSGTVPTDRRFTGQREETGLGLYDYVARRYDPLLGRFIQADTIVPSPQSPQSFNRYAYVLNAPLRYVDPTGHWYGGDHYDPANIETVDEAYQYSRMSGQWSYYWDEVTKVNPYAETQPEVWTGEGPLADFVASPFQAPRLQLNLGDGLGVAKGRVSVGLGDWEWELGLKQNSRLGSNERLLWTSSHLRAYTPDGSWFAIGPSEVSMGRRLEKLPMQGLGLQLRTIDSLGVGTGGVIRAAGTVECTLSGQVAGLELRHTLYLRVASNSYPRRYAAAAVDMGLVVTGVYGVTAAMGQQPLAQAEGWAR